jgi:hypothetical protein
VKTFREVIQKHTLGQDLSEIKLSDIVQQLGRRVITKNEPLHKDLSILLGDLVEMYSKYSGVESELLDFREKAMYPTFRRSP